MEHLNNKTCLKNSRWRGDTLQCSCGRKLAVRYMIDKEVRLFCYGKFIKYKRGILARKDTQEITGESDLFGNLGYEEWEEVIRNVRH